MSFLIPFWLWFAVTGELQVINNTQQWIMYPQSHQQIFACPYSLVSIYTFIILEAFSEW